MKLCQKCNTENSDAAKFCRACGEEISGNEVIHEVVESSKNKTKSPKIALIAVLGVALFVLLSVTVYGYFTNDPVNRVLLSYDKTFNAEEYEAVSTIRYDIKTNISDDDVALATNILEEVYMKILTQKKDKQLFSKISFIYKDDAIVEMELYADEELVSINIPLLYDEVFYLKWEEVDDFIETMNEEFYMDIPELSYSEYVKLIDLDNSEEFGKIDDKKYITLTQEYLEDKITKGDKVDVSVEVDGKDKTVKCQEYIIEQEQDELIDFMEELLETAAEDEEIKNFLTAKFNEFCDILIETEDYEKLYIEEDDIEDARDELEDVYEDGMDELLDSFEYSLESEMPEEFKGEYTIKYRIDSKKQIRSVEATNTIEAEEYGEMIKVETTSETVYNSFKNIKIEKPDTDDGINLADINQQDIEVIGYEIQANIMEFIMTNDTFSQLFQYNMGF